jgi:hypothetical protein
MFAQYISEATSFPEETSLAWPTSFAEGKHHSKTPHLSIKTNVGFLLRKSD